MRNRLTILCLLLTYCFTVPANATVIAGEYCKIRKLGWNFYCDSEVEEEEETKETPQKPAATAKTPDDYLAERDAIRKELEWKMARAVLYPTQENIIDYIRTQRDKALEPSTKFTENWKRAIWTTPDIDYTLKRPVNTIGKQAWTDQQNIIRTSTIQKIDERYGVFFFYTSTCAYCRRYSPILKNFAAKHNMKVMPVSMDGGVLPEWPETVFNQGQADKMGMRGKPVPATILFDNKTKEIVPVGYGLMAMDELEQRIYVMTTAERDDEY